MSPRSAYATLILIAVAMTNGAGVSAWAAPTQAESDTGTASVEAERTVPPNAAPDAVGNSKTIQLLLELQGSKPSATADEMPARAERTGRPLPQAPAANAVNTFDRSTLFGGAPLESAQPGARDARQPGNVEWSGNLKAGNSSAGSSFGASNEPYAGGRPGVADSAAPDIDVRGWMPASLLRFVRENREIVLIGSVVILLAIWAGAALVTQKRH